MLMIRCFNCGKKFDADDENVESHFYDDDEDDNGNTRWVGDAICPYCGEECDIDYWDCEDGYDEDD